MMNVTEGTISKIHSQMKKTRYGSSICRQIFRFNVMFFFSVVNTLRPRHNGRDFDVWPSFFSEISKVRESNSCITYDDTDDWPTCQTVVLSMLQRVGASSSWWRHQMETFSALLAICAGNSPVTGEFPAQRPVTRSFDVFFDLRLNERLSKQSWLVIWDAIAPIMTSQ